MLAGVSRPPNGYLGEVAAHIERLRWSAALLDDDLRLAWVSTELKGFLRVTDDASVGIGLHFAEALSLPAWLRTVEPDGLPGVIATLGPYLAGDVLRRGRTPAEVFPQHLLPLYEQVEALPVPPVFSFRVPYLDPAQPGLGPNPVDCLFIELRQTDGSRAGAVTLFYMGVRPSLVALLSRGDPDMYERMARLTEPAARRAAIMFCDLHGSVALSRRIPSITYFRLIRDLWSGLDQVVADERGVIGKHAGDGASAYFLTEDLGTPSACAAAALRAARRTHVLAEEAFRGTLEEPCRMRIGLHWGGGLYMGQLVPGGRLDISALGDEVNEAARVQECAGPGETLATKQLLEQLLPGDAARLGIDVEKLSYRSLSELPGASGKAVRDVGALPVTTV